MPLSDKHTGVEQLGSGDRSAAVTLPGDRAANEPLRRNAQPSSGIRPPKPPGAGFPTPPAPGGAPAVGGMGAGAAAPPFPQPDMSPIQGIPASVFGGAMPDPVQQARAARQQRIAQLAQSPTASPAVRKVLEMVIKRSSG